MSKNLDYEIKQKIFPLIQNAEMEIVEGNFGAVKKNIQKGYREIQMYEKQQIEPTLLNNYKLRLKELEQIIEGVKTQ